MQLLPNNVLRVYDEKINESSANVDKIRQSNESTDLLTGI